MLYVYQAVKGLWHEFQGNYDEYDTWKDLQDWCKANEVERWVRDEMYFNSLQIEQKYIVKHGTEETTKETQAMNTQQEAEYRVNLKRELRAKGIKVNSSESTTNLERLLAGEILPTPINASIKATTATESIFENVNQSYIFWFTNIYIYADAETVKAIKTEVYEIAHKYNMMHIQQNIPISHSAGYQLRISIHARKKESIDTILAILKAHSQYHQIKFSARKVSE